MPMPSPASSTTSTDNATLPSSGFGTSRVSLRGHAGWMAAFRIALTRFALVVLGTLLLVTRSRWAEDSPVVSAVLMTTGLLLTGVAAAGRLWCSLYIAGRKNRVLVTDGPYSVSRNPLYFFSLLGACGAAMATGMVSAPLILAVLFIAGYRPVILAEEVKLAHLFGAGYLAYRNQVPRFLPRWRLFRHGEPPQVTPRVFLDHALCVIWFPAAAGFLVLLHAAALSLHLPVWFVVY